ncbi:MAG: hypothetical protein D6692_00420 [Planctomycetota bacterium]|nr:MAG: hypothetical protein D6692_00420 [Planctomycetota bacterium]
MPTVRQFRYPQAFPVMRSTYNGALYCMPSIAQPPNISLEDAMRLTWLTRRVAVEVAGVVNYTTESLQGDRYDYAVDFTGSVMAAGQNPAWAVSTYLGAGVYIRRQALYQTPDPDNGSAYSSTPVPVASYLTYDYRAPHERVCMERGDFGAFWPWDIAGHWLGDFVSRLGCRIYRASGGGWHFREWSRVVKGDVTVALSPAPASPSTWAYTVAILPVAGNPPIALDAVVTVYAPNPVVSSSHSLSVSYTVDFYDPASL